jgi:hypothetical protein
MIKTKLVVLFTILTLILPNIIKAQGEAAVPFLLVAPDSRAGGMGESGVGLADNAAAIFWNPAGLAFLRGSEVQITHSNWLPQFHLDLFYDFLAYRQYIDDIDGTISAGVTFMNFGEFIRTGEGSSQAIGTFRSFDVAATVGYSTKITESLGLGFNFRVIHSRLSDQPTAEEQGSGVATSISFDIGAMYRPQSLHIPFIGDMSNRVSLGANLSNLGPKIYYIDQAQADPIPTNLKVGYAIRLFENDYNSLTITNDFNKLLVTKHDSTTQADPFYEAVFTSWKSMNQINFSVGMEYWYGDPSDFMFALRTGFFYEDPNYGNRKFATFGAGLRYDLYAFDFSYISTSLVGGDVNHPLAQTLRFSLSIKWGEQKESVRGFPRGI